MACLLLSFVVENLTGLRGRLDRALSLDFNHRTVKDDEIAQLRILAGTANIGNCAVNTNSPVTRFIDSSFLTLGGFQTLRISLNSIKPTHSREIFAYD